MTHAEPAARQRARRVRAVLRLWAVLACVAEPLTAAPRVTAQRTAGTPSRPDRALYQEAQRLHAGLRTSRKLQTRAAEWEKVALAYRRVLARYPQSPYCDNALLAIGGVYRDMAQRFKSARAWHDAIEAYRLLVAEYPSSSLGEQALAAVVEIERARGDRRRLAEAASAYLDAFPDGPRVAEIKALVRRSAPERAGSLPSAPPPGLAQVFNLRFWSGAASTRVVVDVQKQVRIRYDRIANPDRLWIDLQGARLHPNLKDRLFPVGDGLLEKIRVGQNQDDVVRVVLDFKEVDRHSVFYLQDPPRLVIDVQGTAPPQMASAEPVTPASVEPTPGPAVEPAPPPLEPTATPAPPGPDLLATRRVAASTPRSEPSPPPNVTARRTSDIELELPPARPAPKPSPSPTAPTRAAQVRPTPAPPSPTPPPTRAAASTPAPTPAPSAPPLAPQPNRNGSISLARQLGLGARRIVVDAGHGGHDPGTIGRAGLQEKDLVLDVARRVAALLREEAGAEVLMTRDSDVFIPLEERTAIANSKGADLFLSIHANSSRNAQARGIETYFLNFARNAHAEGVAARENAISAATLKDLQGLVKAIALNSKIDESRDFAASVQEALVRHLRAHYGRDVVDRGVHTAPFYVLIGANMPSVLAEIAFVSHPEEERRLRTPEYRERIARSLFEGVRAYLETLNRARPRQLTRARPGPTVARRGARR